jgi:hypothetical protein
VYEECGICSVYTVCALCQSGNAICTSFLYVLIHGSKEVYSVIDVQWWRKPSVKVAHLQEAARTRPYVAFKGTIVSYGPIRQLETTME